MTSVEGNTTMSRDAKNAKPNGFFGTLKDALMAAGRDELPDANASAGGEVAAVALPPMVISPSSTPSNGVAVVPVNTPPQPRLTAEEAARLARQKSASRDASALVPATDADGPPTTRVVRREAADTVKPARTQLVRGRQKIERRTFDRDPVVGFFVVVGGPGLGSHRPIFEGNNTIGRSPDNRVALDFGDDTISSEAQG